MKYFGLDCETDDPLLTDQGPSWVYNKGEILVTGIYDAQKAEKKAIDGKGGAVVRNLLLSASTALVGANIGYDLGWLCHEHKLKAKQTKCTLIDVAIAESLIDEYQPFSLDALARKYLKERKGSEALAAIALEHGLKGDFRKHLSVLWHGRAKTDKLSAIPAYKEEIRAYVISDADQPVRIWEYQRAILEEQGLMPAFIMNMKLTRITLGMKQHGVRIDYPKWQENCAIADKAFNELHDDFMRKYNNGPYDKVLTKVQPEINVNSSKQLAELFDRYDVPYKYKLVFKGWAPEGRKFNAGDWFAGDELWDQRERLKKSFPSIRVEKKKIVLYIPKQYAERTAFQAQQMGYQITCNPSCGKTLFEETKAFYPVVADVVEFKQIISIITKFLGPNFERFLVVDANGDYRLHGNFDPVGARQTGRLSASKPNLQNIPSKTKLFEKTEKELDLAHMCREVFLPERGEMIVKLDFSGQENVLQAHFAVGAAGERIRAMYRENPRLDEHQFVADRSGLQEKHGEKVGRKYAKNIRFGVAYGMMLTRLCQQFGWEKEFAQELLDAVLDACPWVPETMAAIQDMLLGRGAYRGRARRYIKTIYGRRVHLREGNDRDAYKFYNYLIQGSASDMMKLALIAFDESPVAEFVSLLLTVHDEGDFSVPITPEGFAAVLLMQGFFCNAVKLEIPINADPEVGANWADAEGQKKGKNPGDPYFVETVEEMMTRVGEAILSGKTDIVDKTAEPCEDEDDDFDFIDFSDDDDDEESDE